MVRITECDQRVRRAQARHEGRRKKTRPLVLGVSYSLVTSSRSERAVLASGTPKSVIAAIHLAKE